MNAYNDFIIFLKHKNRSHSILLRFFIHSFDSKFGREVMLKLNFPLESNVCRHGTYQLRSFLSSKNESISRNKVSPFVHRKTTTLNDLNWRCLFICSKRNSYEPIVMKLFWIVNLINTQKRCKINGMKGESVAWNKCIHFLDEIDYFF